MVLPEREQYGATLIPVRTAEGGGLEVLLGQNPVVDFVKSESSAGDGVSIRSYGGELRFLGSRAALDEDSTPLDTAVRDLTPVGWPDMLATILTIMSSRPEAAAVRPDVHPALFCVSEKLTDECIRVYSFVCPVGGPSKDDSLSRALNEQMKSQHEACDAYGDKFFDLSREARAALAPKLRNLEWRRVSEVVVETAPDKEFVNDWQREMFQRFGLSRRQVAWATCHTLQQLCKYRTAEEALEEARRFERAVRASPGSVSAQGVPDLAVCLPDREELMLLSYNLNVLPWGAQLFGSGQGVAAATRLAIFLERLEDQPPAVRPDILAVQELFGTPFLPVRCHQRMFVERMARLGYSAVTAGRPTITSLLLMRKWTDSGLVIFSRLPIVSTGELLFNVGTGLDAGAAKGAVWARVRLAAGKFLDVFNCHLQATHTGAGSFEAVRWQQLQSLQQFVGEKAGGQPYVLTGDFNVDAIAEPDDPRGAFGYALRPPSSESADYKAMLRILDPYNESVDLLLQSQGEPGGHPCTRPPRQHFPTSAAYTIRHKHPQRLDYVFFRPTTSSLVEHLRSEVARFEVTGHPELTYLSDHWAIRSHFRIKCGFAWKDSRVEARQADREQREVARGGTAFAVALGLLQLLMAVLWHTYLPSRLLHFFVMACLGLTVVLWRFVRNASPPQPAGAKGAVRKNLKASASPTMPSQANNPYAAFVQSGLRHCSRRCLGKRTVNSDGTRGKYEWLTYEQVHRRVLLLASGLRHEFFLHPKSKVGLLGDVCVEWMLSELALMQCGVQTMCLLNLEDVRRGTVDLLLCSNEWVEHILDRSLELGTPVVAFEPLSARFRARAGLKTWRLVDIPYCVELADVRGLVSQGYSAAWATFTSMTRWSSTDAEADSQVFISMQQLAQKAATVSLELNLGPDDVHFSYQAPAWIGERVLLHATLAAGGAIGFFQGVRSPKVFDDIRTLRPTFLTGTPNVFFDQLRQLQETQASRLGILGRFCFAVQGAFLDRGWRAPYVLDLLMRRFRQEVLGSVQPRFVLILCTPTQACTQHAFCRWLRTLLVCPVLKSLVLTEAAGFVTLGEAPYWGGSVKSFFVGLPLPYVDLSIQEVPDLGILPADTRCDEMGRMGIGGPSVVVSGAPEGADPTGQARVHSGARLDVLSGRRGARVFVFGRLSSAATISGGRRVLLDAMEQLCTQHVGRWLSQLFLTVRRGVLVSVAAVQLEHLWREALKRNLCRGAALGAEDLCRHAAVRAWCLGDLRRSCSGLDLGLPIVGLHLVAEPFSCENGLQTPTFQLQRANLERRFADAIEQMAA